MQDDAIEKLTSSLDGMATYQKLPSGAHFVTAPRSPIVVIYDRDPAGNAIVLDVVPARSNWKPSP